jgi:hypothetical protein
LFERAAHIGRDSHRHFVDHLNISKTRRIWLMVRGKQRKAAGEKPHRK